MSWARPCRCAAWTTPATTAWPPTNRATWTTPAAATSWRWTGPPCCGWAWTRCAPGPLYGGVDGFRLDLATTLGRRDTGFDPHAPFLSAIEQDPVLSRRVMIAEPWDIGPGGYQLGAFPARWGEWNDRFRNTVRRFWRGDAGMLGEFTTRFAGSADVFARRPLSRGINFITAHDGFTLADLVVLRDQAQPGERRGQPRRLRRQPVVEQRRGGSILRSRRSWRRGPAMCGRCSPRCCCRAARRCCRWAMNWAAPSSATTTPTRRTTPLPGWTGPAPTVVFYCGLPRLFLCSLLERLVSGLGRVFCSY